MPLELTTEQKNDLREITTLCQDLGTNFVVIGAIAYQLYFDDKNRFTSDIDITIALDLDGFSEFARRLEQAGWKRDPQTEHR